VKDFGTRGKLVAVLFALTTMLGCGALDAGTPVAQSNTGLVASSAVLDFGSVPVGTTQVLANTITNKTKSPVVLTRAQFDQGNFSITGQKLPLTLAPGQHVTVQVAYSPQSSGTSLSRIVLATNVDRLFSMFTLKGTAILAGRMRLTPTTISFGNVQIGKTQTQSATVSNMGSLPVIVTRAAISGTGFTLSGLTMPRTLKAGQSASVNVTFTPAAGGPTSGSISVVGTVSMAVPKRPSPFGRRNSEITMVSFNTVTTTLSAPVSGTGMGVGQLAISPTSLALGSVRIGASQTQSATFINSGSSDLVISQATVSGKGFRMSGLSFPLTLAAGQRKSFAVTFTPLAAGNASGSIAVTTDASSTVLSVPVSANATASGALTSNPSSISFGSVQVGQGQTLSAALTNSGGSTVNVSQANVAGSGFTIGGLSLPVALAPGQSTGFSVTFKPQSGGPASGTVSFSSDASNGTLAVPITGSAATAGSLVSTPASLSFSKVQAGTPQTISETLTNSGGSSLTIGQANLTGPGFTMTGLTLPLTLAAGQSATFTVTFTPTSGGAASGGLAIGSNASNSTLNIPLTANAATSGVLSTSDSSLNFGSVQVNGTATQPETLTNSGSASVTVSQAKVSGTGFSVTGLNLPMTLSPGQSFTFGAAFSPTSGASASGSIVVTSDASNSTLTITLAGTPTVPGQLAVSPATLSFGNVTVGQSKSLTGSLTATGSSITVSSASLSTSEFTISGLSFPLTLTAGQSASFTIKFAPQASGIAAASGAFNSNASNASLAEALSGTGAAAPQHSVALSWNASTSSVVGYNVYRGSASGGPYSKINSMDAATTYTDTSVQSGQSYFYVTTGVDSSGRESANSNQTQAVIPTP
jgi:Abnormal spindle-like microcephaly-assoc'd, ASPM-SPD-2-Hydin